MLELRSVSFDYGNVPLFSGLSFTVKRGEHLSVIGESGSGKTTLLNMIFGEFDLLSGEILWENKPILGPKFNLITGYDFMKKVSQEFDLMPFVSVEESIGGYLSNFFPKKKRKRTLELAKVVELEEFLDTPLTKLSGGQKQRVALARALAKKPEIILLDEPFSHIDNFKKQGLRRKLFDFLKKENISCIVATHDKDDVLGFSDRIIVLGDGKIIEQGSPEKLFREPKTSLTASFFGEYNKIPSQWIDPDDNGRELIIYAHQLKLVNNSPLEVAVQKSRFKGEYYLNEGVKENKLIFFHSKEKLTTDQRVFLEI